MKIFKNIYRSRFFLCLFGLITFVFISFNSNAQITAATSTTSGSPYPEDGMCPASGVSIQVKYRNDGASAVNMAITPVTIKVNLVHVPTGNTQTYSSTISSGTISANSTKYVTLTAAADFLSYGTYEFHLIGYASNDADAPPAAPLEDAVESIFVAGNFIDLTSAAGTAAQSVCQNVAITDITYDVSYNATDATASGLPDGVTYSYTYPTLTISGTPTTAVGSPFTYTVTATGSCPAANDSTLSGTLTVVAAPTVTFTGATEICIGDNTNLSPAAGGTWVSSDDAVATVDNTGLVAGVAVGTATFTFTDGGTGCSNTTTSSVTVSAPVTSGVLSGNQAICEGQTSTFSSTVAGGSWTSGTPAVATIVAGTGDITGVSGGTSTMTYTVTGLGGCPDATDTRDIVVTALPSAGTLSGSQEACLPGGSTFTSDSPGGSWSSSDPTVATIVAGTGDITSVGVGTATMTYLVTGTGGCLDVSDTRDVTVTLAPDPGVLSGTDEICEAQTSTFSSTVAGGTWSSSDPTIASVIGGTGVITGEAGGVATMTYTVAGSGGCADATNTRDITITAIPIAGTLSGVQAICNPGTSTFVSDSPGGTWSSGTPAVATIDANTGDITAVSSGTSTMTYTMTGTGGCADVTATRDVTITNAVSAGILSGTTDICTGDNSVFSSTVAGGTWTSGTVGVATITPATGDIASVSAGSSVMTYTVSGSGGCSDASDTRTLNVTDPVTSGVLSGTQSICVASTTTFSSTVAGGTWTSSDAGVATVDLNTGDVTGVGAGTATITYTVAGAGGCLDATSTRTVTVTAAPSAGILSGTQAICVAGVSTLSSTVAGGTWSSATAGVATIDANTGDVLGISAGTSDMTYTVAGAGGCADATDVLTVTVTDAPSAGILSGTQAICEAGVSTLSSTVAGGTWSSASVGVATIDANTGDVLGISAGTSDMTYTVAGAGGCADATDVLTITVTAAPSAGVLSGTQTVCATANTTFSSTVAGGTWSSASTNIATIDAGTGVILGVADGASIITYTVTGAGGCADATATRTVNVTGLNTSTLTSAVGTDSQVLCTGSSITDITYATTGATGATFSGLPTGTSGSWNANVVTITGTPTTSGAYTVTLTGGCGNITSTGTITVNSNNTITLTSGAGSNNQSACTNSAITDITFSTTGATGATFSNLPTGVSGQWVGDVVTLSGTPTAAGVFNYTVTLTGGCGNITATGTITVTASPTVAAITGSNSVCVAASTTLSNTTAGGTWSTSNGAIASVGSATGIVTGVSAGTTTINYTVTSNGCSTVVPFTITVVALPDAGTISGSDDVCVSSNTTYTNSVGGGVWSSSNTANATVGLTGIISGVASGTSVITYSVTSGGCTNTSTKTINVIALPTVNAITGTTTICNGSTSTLSSTTIGGVWSSSNTSVATINSASGLVTSVGVGSTTITYTVTINGCSDSKTTSVTVNAVPTVAAITGSSSVCVGSSITLADATAGGTWGTSDAAVATVTAGGVVTGVSAGTISITYSITTNGCTTTESKTVTVYAMPTVDPISGTTTVCKGASSQLSNTTAGGTWSSGTPANASITAAGLVTGLNAGTSSISYAVTENGCTTTVNTTVTINDAVTVSSIGGTTSICEGATSQLTNATNGGTWSSSDVGVATISPTGLVSGLSAGSTTISYTVTTNGLCPQVATATMTINLIPTVDPISDVSVCQGDQFGTISFSGNGAATYLWTNSNTSIGLVASGSGNIAAFTGSGTVFGGASATGIIEVTPNLNGCVGNPEQFFMTVNSLQDPGFSYPSYSYCNLDANPIPTISGNSGGTFTSAPVGLSIDAVTGEVNLAASAEGYFNITYSNIGGCSQDSTVTIGISNNPTVTAVSDQAVCQDAPFTAINFFGSAGTSFSWTNSDATIGLASSGTGNIASFNASGTSQGDPTLVSTVIVTPIAGSCAGTKDTFLLSVKSLDNASFTYPSNSFCKTLDANPVANITGAAGGIFSSTPAGMSFNPSTGLINLSTSTNGTYNFTYTTNLQCSNSSSLSITIGDNPSVNAISDQTVCLGSSFADIIFSGTSGTVYTWTNSNTAIGLPASGTGDILSFVGAGASLGTPSVSSTITVTPTIGSCTGVSKTFTLTVNYADDATIAYSDLAYCQSDANPTPTIIGTQGGVFSATPAGLVINSSTGIVDLVASTQGAYSIMYRTIGSCADTSIVSFGLNNNPTVNNLSNQTKCAGFNFNAISFTGTAGTIFDWTNNNTAIGLAISGTGDISSFTATNSTTASILGTITVVPRAGSCVGTSKQMTLTVNPATDATFSYSASTYCANATTELPTISGTSGGTFSSTAGLSLNASTGSINFSTSTAGTYNVQYVTPGACTAVSSKTIKINPTPSVNAISDQIVCEGSNFSPISISGTVSTIFAWSNSNSSIGLASNGTGSIASFKGTGTTTGGASATGVVTVTPSIGSCVGATKSFLLTVNSIDDPSYSYSDNSYCTTETNPTPAITGTSGGTFSVLPVTGLTVGSSSGTIDLSTATNGTYTITYTTNGFCSQDSSVSISIGTTPIVTAIADQTRCNGSMFTAITFSGNPGTVYDWTNDNTQTGLASSGTGDITAFAASGTSVGGTAIQSKVIVTPRSGSCVGVKDTFLLKVNPLDNATFTYSNSSYCKTQSNPSPTITGLTGGSFSATPVGMSLNSVGVINLTATTSGTYSVKYTTAGSCPNNSTQTIAIGNAPSVNTISDQSVCNGQNFNAISFTGSAGSVFNWSNSNPSIGLAASGTGNIASFTSLTTGSAVIVVTPVSGTCVGTSKSFTLTSNATASSTIAYGQSSYCTSDANPTPLITGTNGGVFSSSPAGLSINTSSGLVTLASSNPGTYTVTYTLSGLCASSSTTTISVGSTPSVNAVTSQAVCNGGTFSKVTFTGNSGSQFSWTNSNTSIGLAASGSGAITAFSGVNTGNSASIATITVTPFIGSCTGTSKNFTLTVNPSDNAAFSYASSSYCANSSNPTPTITGTSGGTFTFTPTGLSINASSGKIDISASTAQTYNVTYLTSGACPKASTQSVTLNPLPTVNSIVNQETCEGSSFSAITFSGSSSTIFDWTNDNTAIGLASSGSSLISSFKGIGTTKNGPSIVGNIQVTPRINSCTGSPITFKLTVNSIDDASFAYSNNSMCQSTASYTPTITGTSGGSFTSSPAGLSLNGSTGRITISSSTIGSYNLTYTTNGKCKVDSTIAIIINPTPSVNAITSQSKCFGQLFDTIFFSGTTNTQFNWVNTNTVIGLASSGSDTISAFKAIGTVYGGPDEIGNITVTPLINGCSGTTKSFTLTVNPIDDPSFTYADNSFCTIQANPTPTISGTNGGVFTATPAGLSLNSSTGLIDLATSTANTYTITYTTPGSCFSDSSVVIGIGTTPSVLDVDDQILCQGSIFDAVTFSGNPGTIFEWTNSNTSIGYNVATGNGNIPSFKASGTTPGSIDQSATIQVIPRIGTCIGTQMNYKYKVRALPNIQASILTNPVSINLVKDTSFCKGSNATLKVTGAPSASDYTWSPHTALVGSTISGSTVITNVDSTQQYIVFGRNASGCQNSDTVTVYVYNPKVYALTDTSICAGNTFNQIIFKGNVPTPTFSWTNSNANIGLGFSGVGTIPAFVGKTSGANTKESATITVVPKYTIPSTGEVCTGISQKFNLDVIKVDDPTFTGYAGQYCATETLNSVPTISGKTGGVFTSSPVGLAINSSTGQIYPNSSVSGSYTIKYSTNGTCPSADSIDIFINPSITASMSLNKSDVCMNDASPVVKFAGGNGVSPYSFSYTIDNGPVLIAKSTAGSDSVKLSVPTSSSSVKTYKLVGVQDASALACSSTIDISKTIKVQSLPSAQVSGTTTLCQGDNSPTLLLTGLNGTSPFTFTYAINGVTQNIVSSKAGENNYEILAPTNNQGTFTYSVVGIKDGGPLGCSQAQPQNPSAVVTIKPLPTATISAPATKEICMNSSANMKITGTNGISPFTFVYKVNNGSNVSVLSDANGVATIPVNSTKADTLVYSLVSVRDGSSTNCLNTNVSSKDSIIIIPGVYVNELTDTTVCVGESSKLITFTGSSNTTFSWISDNITTGIALNGTNTIQAFVGKNTSNSLVNKSNITVTPISGSCIGETMKFSINVRPLPEPKIAPINTICPGDTATLVGQGAYTYIWTPKATLSCDQCATVKAFPTQSTEYKIFVSDPYGCKITTDFVVPVYDKPFVSAEDVILCGEPDSVRLYGKGASTYTWSNGITNGQPFIPQHGVNKYVVTGTDDKGCKNTDTVLVSVLDKPTANFDVNTSSGLASVQKPLNILVTNNSINSTSYLWDFKNGDAPLSVDNSNPQTALYTLPGTYVISLTAFNGICENTTYKEIQVEKLDTPSVLIAPNVFSPNGDGSNDLFFITVNNAKTIHLSIFNRWGNIVHEITETTQTWDGKINGYDADEGVYFYNYEIEGVDGQKVKGQGFIQLIRK